MRHFIFTNRYALTCPAVCHIGLCKFWASTHPDFRPKTSLFIIGYFSVMLDWELRYLQGGIEASADINRLLNLMKETLGATQVGIADAAPSAFTRLKHSAMPPRPAGNLVRLYMANRPSELSAAIADPDFDKPAKYRIAWIFESFWTDDIPKLCLSAFDLIILTQSCDVPTYRDAGARDILVLPWGSDVLRLGAGNGHRPVDVIGLGDQPKSLLPEAEFKKEAEELGVRYANAPSADLTVSQYFGTLSGAKYVTLFSNLVSQRGGAHPTKEYFTGLWANALASGASVIGIAPHSDRSFSDILWDGALIDVGSTDRGKFQSELRRAIANWSKDQPRRNYLRSLERLDWRWRIKTLCEHLATDTDALKSQLDEIQEFISGNVAIK